MSRTKAELEAMLSSARALDLGEAQIAALEDVVRHADAGGFDQLAFSARRELADSCSNYGLWDRAFPLFSRCLSEYDSRPFQYSASEERSLRSWYTGIVQSMAEFPEISRAQLEDTLSDIERRFRAGGHTLRSVHQARQWIALLARDWEAEERAYHDWLAAGGGADTKDIWTFEAHLERLLRRGDSESLEAAFRLADPVIAGDRIFDQGQWPVQCQLLMPLLRAGRPADAVRMLRRSGQAMRGKGSRVEYSGYQVEFCALTGNFDKGLDFLTARMHLFNRMKRPNGKMELALGGSLLLGGLIDAGRGDELAGCDCGEEPLVPVKELYEQLTQIVTDTAAAFDARNGHTAHGDWIRGRLAQKRLAMPLGLAPLDRKSSIRVSPGQSALQLLEHAERAVILYEFDAARKFLDAIGDPPPHLLPRCQTARAEANLNEPAHEQLLRDAIAGHERFGDVRREQLARAALGLFLVKAKRYSEGRELTTSAVRVLRGLGDNAALTRAEFRAAQAASTKGPDDSYSYLGRATSLAALVADPKQIGLIAWMEAMWRNGDGHAPATVIALAEQAVRVLIPERASTLVVYSLDEMQKAYERDNRAAEFTAYVERTLLTLPLFASPMVRGHLRYLRGVALLRAGDAGAAIPDLADGVAQAYADGGASYNQWRELAIAYHAESRWEEAFEAADMIGDWAWKRYTEKNIHYDLPQLLEVRAILGDAKRGMGQLAKAHQQYTTLVEHARQVQLPSLEGRGLRGLAQVLEEQKRDAEAGVRYAEAAGLAAAAGDQTAALADYRAALQAMLLGDKIIEAQETLLLADAAAGALPDDPDGNHAWHWAELDRIAARVLGRAGRGPEAVYRAGRSAAAYRSLDNHAEAATSDLIAVQLLRNDQRPDLAEPILRGLLQSLPGDNSQRPAVTYALAEVLDSLGRGTEANQVRAGL